MYLNEVRKETARKFVEIRSAQKNQALMGKVKSVVSNFFEGLFKNSSTW